MTTFGKIHHLLIRPILEARNNIHTTSDLKFLIKSDNWSRDQLDDFQWQRIKILLAHAFDHSPFYRERFNKLGLKPNDIKTFDDYENIPSISRQDINEHLEEMIANNLQEKDIHYSSTGGSTGLPTRFARDNKCLEIKLASEYRFNTWCGWSPGEKILYYWPALADFTEETISPKMMKERLYSRRLKIFSGRLNDKMLAEHADMLRRFKPQIIRAFPGALNMLAEYLESKGEKIPQIRSIISVGESLHESQREIFQRVFRAEVFNCYVSRECGNIACECEAHQGLHITEELLYVEIRGNNQDEYGKILITDLWNMGMPFIRYEIQDAARWETRDCTCGRKHKMLGIDTGRLSDFLISPADGSTISGSAITHYLLAEGPQMGRVKFIQTAPNQLKVLIASGINEYLPARQHIQERLDRIFEGKMRIEYECTDRIPLLPSGKYSVVERKY